MGEGDGPGGNSAGHEVGFGDDLLGVHVEEFHEDGSELDEDFRAGERRQGVVGGVRHGTKWDW